MGLFNFIFTFSAVYFVFLWASIFIRFGDDVFWPPFFFYLPVWSWRNFPMQIRNSGLNVTINMHCHAIHWCNTPNLHHFLCTSGHCCGYLWTSNETAENIPLMILKPIPVLEWHPTPLFSFFPLKFSIKMKWNNFRHLCANNDSEK